MNLNSLRPCSDAFDLTGFESSMSVFWPKLWDKKLIVVCGLPCSGKTQTLSHYVPPPDKSFVYWERDKILNMLSPNQEIDFKYMSEVQAFEKSILPKLLDEPFQQLFVEGWLTSKSERANLLKMAGMNKAALLIFDGEPASCFQRASASPKYNNFVMSELRHLIIQKRDRFHWPDLKELEMWSSVYYISTFGQKGVEMLARTCYAV